MLKLIFEQLPDPLSRFECVYTDDDATIAVGHQTTDVYRYFYDDRYYVEIHLQNKKVYKNHRKE